MSNPTQVTYSAATMGLSADTFKPLRIAMNAITYFLKNNGPDNLYLRTDPDDPLTEDFLAPGGWESPSPSIASLLASHRVIRFNAGDVLYYGKGTGPVICKFWL